MADDLTTYGESGTADWIIGQIMYLSAHTADPGQSPDGTTEVGASDYSRADVSASGDWTTAGSNPTTVENAVDVSFPEATSSWGTITHLVVWDAQTDGNPIARYALSSNTDIGANDTLNFPTGEIDFNID